MVLGAAGRVNLFAGRWDPGFYNYGSLLVYVVSVVSQVLDAWFPVSGEWQTMARLTLVGRTCVAAFGVGSVYVAFLIGRRLGGAKAGLLSALTLAVLPMHAVHSHFVTVDVPAAFFVSLSLYQALMWSPERRRAAVLAGVFAGLAAGAKYNAGLVLLGGWAVLLAHRDVPARTRWTAAGAMTLACLAAFLASTPGVLFAHQAFLRDFGYEARHVRTGHGLVFLNTGPGWWYHLRVNLLYGAGWPLLLLAAGAALVRAKDRATAADARAWAAMLAFAIPYYLVISLAAVRFQRYLMPLLIVLAVWTGVRWAASRHPWPAIAGLIATAVWCVALVGTMATPSGRWWPAGTVFRGDPRDAVAAWFHANAPEGSAVGFTRTPWFFSPPLSVANAGPQSDRLFEKLTSEGQGRYRIRTLAPDASTFEEPPDYVVLSDYEMGDALRLAGAGFPERPSEARQVVMQPGLAPEATRLCRLWNQTLSGYDIVGEWTASPNIGGTPLWKRGLPPHDAFYPYPSLLVFRRSDGRRNGR
jgi:4-amino-4-deoxy-L-arabinose transferase-like glycosyltransferase